MCARVVIEERDEKEFRDKIREMFSVEDDTQLSLFHSYNISPGSFLPIVYKDVVIKASNMKWGLIPYSGGTKNKMIFHNSRLETADIKVSFRSSFKKRRCIIPVSGYYEWREEGGIKQPYYFYHKAGKMLALAGLYNPIKEPDKDDLLYTFTIITRPAKGKLSEIHDRTPVILPSHLWDDWLDTSSEEDSEDLKSRIMGDNFEDIEYYKVSTDVNNSRNDTKRLVDRV